MLPEHTFATRLLAWHQQYGRHDLPWQQKNPYVVWVSEVMLQQTQVKTVLGYFERFMQRFPTVAALAQAEWDDVAALWAGLGYYARARNLHKAAKAVHAAQAFPDTLAGWMALSGIGQSTAGAIMSMGQGQYGVILDGNVKRVLTRHAAVHKDITKAATLKELWQLAEKLTPTHLKQNAQYTQAIMDLGATVCTRTKPLCNQCPVANDCEANALGTPTAFPVKKKKKAIPTKTAPVLVLVHENKWLWLQRANERLWGGLWCLPIVSQKDNKKDNKTVDVFSAVSAELHARVQADIDDATVTELKPIKHTFTHFHWLLTPYVYTLNAEQVDAVSQLLLNKQADGLKWQWLDHAYALNTLAKPTAMKKVIVAVAN